MISLQYIINASEYGADRAWRKHELGLAFCYADPLPDGKIMISVDLDEVDHEIQILLRLAKNIIN